MAAELLDIYAQRAAKEGFAFKHDKEQYQLFCDSFPFETTPDQAQAINAVLSDMCQPLAMDRLVCGDVGFGKTEVAMRAAFLAVENNKQVAVLVPTTLLAQQHFDNFRDRFANWPVRIEMLSRFRSTKEQTQIPEQASEGKIDILIGTHKLLQSDVKWKDLGLLIVDEEHRFGVRHKERIKAMRADVDILTLTATPIPRTLNMAMSGMRDLSIIATPPARRLAVKPSSANTIIWWCVRPFCVKCCAGSGLLPVQRRGKHPESGRQAGGAGAGSAHCYRSRADARARAGTGDERLPPSAL